MTNPQKNFGKPEFFHKEKIPVYCSTGTFIGRVNNNDWRLIGRIGGQIDCDGFELMISESWLGRLSRIAGEIARTGFSFPTLHVNKRLVEQMPGGNGNCDALLACFEENCEAALLVGSKKLVLHLWGPPFSDRDFERNIRLFSVLEPAARSRGLLLTVENIPCACADPLARWRQLTGHFPGIAFTFDTRQAAFHKQLADMYAARNMDIWRHIAHVHYSDYSGGHLEWAKLRFALHPGEGEVSAGELGGQLRRAGYCGGVTLESTAMTPDGPQIGRLNASLSALRQAFDPETVDRTPDPIV